VIIDRRSHRAHGTPSCPQPPTSAPPSCPHRLRVHAAPCLPLAHLALVVYLSAAARLLRACYRLCAGARPIASCALAHACSRMSGMAACMPTACADHLLVRAARAVQHVHRIPARCGVPSANSATCLGQLRVQIDISNGLANKNSGLSLPIPCVIESTICNG
jgi:hypothetical protein